MWPEIKAAFFTLSASFFENPLNRVVSGDVLPVVVFRDFGGQLADSKDIGLCKSLTDCVRQSRTSGQSVFLQQFLESCV